MYFFLWSFTQKATYHQILNVEGKHRHMVFVITSTRVHVCLAGILDFDPLLKLEPLPNS
jgi:hypothetical protein